MAHISVRKAILDRFPSADLGVGIFAALMHPAYDGQRGTFPYTSLRDWLHSLEWPPSSAYDYLGDYPEEGAPGWTDNIQGVTSDGSHWFFTAESEGIWKFPLSHGLDADIEDEEFAHAPVPSPFDDVDSPHMGDPDQFEGFVFVPFEGTNPRCIMMFRASDLQFLDSAPIAEQSDAP